MIGAIDMEILPDTVNFKNLTYNYGKKFCLRNI